jgi:NAD(P)-dependent dehydrogenase (short-subunit alcohol dehydrogenase family)
MCVRPGGPARPQWAGNPHHHQEGKNVDVDKARSGRGTGQRVRGVHRKPGRVVSAAPAPVRSYGRLVGKTAVITGAGAGMGRAGALLFAREGADLALCDIDAQALAETVRLVGPETNVTVYATDVDLVDVSAIEEFVVEAINRFEVIDAIYNNAGVTLVRPIEETSLEDWERLHAINVRAAAFLVKYALPALRRSPAASIINVASGAAVQAAIDGNTVYCSSKGAVLALTRAQARDLAADRIRANCILPGPIETALVRHHLDSLPPDEAERKRAGFVSRTMFKRFGQPEEVASVAVFLATGESSYINGAAIPVDNGWAAM